MPAFCENRYSKFKFLVSLGGGQGADELDQIVGGFSDAGSLGMDVNYSDYRNGNQTFNTARMVLNPYKFAEVTLKRGLVAHDLIQWINTVHDGTGGPRQVQITMFDEARNPVATFTLHNSRPMKVTSSMLAAKGPGEVALEELSLVHEGIEYHKPPA